MNTLVILPAILLGRAIDVTLAFEKGQATLSQTIWAALTFLGGALATQIPRLGNRWWLMTANTRILANIRADALRGALNWPMDRLQKTSIVDLMARIVGDVQVLGVGIYDFTVEIWDTVLFSISVITTLLLIAPHLTALLQEQLAGIRVLKLFGRTQAAGQRVEECSRKLAKENFTVVRLREGLQPVYSMLMYAGVLLVITVGGQQVIDGPGQWVSSSLT